MSCIWTLRKIGVHPQSRNVWATGEVTLIRDSDFQLRHAYRSLSEAWRSITVRGIFASLTQLVLTGILQTLRGSQGIYNICLPVHLEVCLLSPSSTWENTKLLAWLVTPRQQIRQVEEETEISCRGFLNGAVAELLKLLLFPEEDIIPPCLPAGVPWQTAGVSFYSSPEVTLEAPQEQSDNLNTLLWP